MPRRFRFLALASALLGLAAAARPAQGPTPPKSGYAPVNGLKMYYEVHGQGRPLVLLHGSFLNIDMAFGQLIPELAKSRQVIALEFQAHGRTADIDRPITVRGLADDVAALLQYLNAGPADVFGYSLGGVVALDDFTREARGVRAPTLLIVGDSDGILPEHVAEMFRLRGGGANGDLGGRSPAQLAVFPATSHVAVMMHTDWLLAILPPFLND